MFQNFWTNLLCGGCHLEFLNRKRNDRKEKYFSDKHEWVDVDEKNKTATVGVTHYAQDKLGEIVFVQLPEIGQALEAHGEAGVLESVKAASDVYSPISGKVTAVNTTIVDNPKLINDSPYKDGWMFKCTVGDPKDLVGLMDEAGYEEYVKTCD
ncbi:hypothetical protein DPMN_174730 [Dreissena polymorpha]|uniref:Glycine cleavage system H protein n=1 Tax=Dreissena polymorpha TaxID=45954 RepID=A0A9D4E560_DREPO|nr:hypothetical protein DPMN_174730 [Dreissena polymorpha]